jgi:hypothetical protein
MQYLPLKIIGEHTKSEEQQQGKSSTLTSINNGVTQDHQREENEDRNMKMDSRRHKVNTGTMNIFA